MDRPNGETGAESGETKEILWKNLVALLLQEQYLLTAFELLHELLEDGQFAAAGQLQDFFADAQRFPPDQMMQLQSLPALNLQKLSDEKEAALSKVAVMEYELRLAQEDMKSLQQRLEQQQAEALLAPAAPAADAGAHAGGEEKRAQGGREPEDDEEAMAGQVAYKRQISGRGVAIGKEERCDLNCAVKEYLVEAGYKLTAMTFYDEVVDQDLDRWQSGPAHVEAALRTYYHHFLTRAEDAGQVERLEEERQDLLSRLQDADAQKESLAAKIENQLQAGRSAEEKAAKREAELLHFQKRSEAASRDLQESQERVAALRLELQQMQLRAEQALARNEALEVEKASALEKARAAQEQVAQLSRRVGEASAGEAPRREAAPAPVASAAPPATAAGPAVPEGAVAMGGRSDAAACGERVAEGGESEQSVRPKPIATEEEASGGALGEADVSSRAATGGGAEPADALPSVSGTDGPAGIIGTEVDGAASPQLGSNNAHLHEESIPAGSPDRIGGEEGEGQTGAGSAVDGGRRVDLASLSEAEVEELRRQVMKEDEGAVVIIAEALPKIIPNVLINRRDELLPLMLCAIERHPDPATRDSLTHGLFNLIKKPDEDQRRMIMQACVALAAKVGEERTENELLPQCWEQISHKFAERRLLVAQSCGELAKYVPPATRSSLILSILEQLADDAAHDVREGVAQNLALLLPDIEDVDKYPKVEDMTFRLVCDPAGEVVEESLQRLVPALVAWAKAKRHPLSHLLRSLLQRILSNIQHCRPASGVEGSPEANLRVLGERQRWSVDVLLRMLVDLLPEVRHAAVKTCPAALKEGMENGIGLSTEEGDVVFSEDLLRRYASLSQSVHWPALDWVVSDCLPALLQLACMLSPREEVLRLRLSKVLLSICRIFGRHFTASMLLPVVLAAAGYPVDSAGMPEHLSSKAHELRPTDIAGERLARMCVLPLLLVGVLGAPGLREKALANYLRELVLSTCLSSGPWSERESPDLIDAVRFLCTQTEHHDAILAVLWELVVNPTPSVRMTAAALFQALAGYVSAKRVSQQVLPALVTLGSDPNLDVKYSSIAAFGAVALHFKDEMIVEKIRIQMESYLEDGSQEAALAVVRALTAAVPVTSSQLRDYLLQKLVVLASTTLPSVQRQQDRLEQLCAAVRALDGTDLSSASVQNYLLPVVQMLLKEPDSLTPSSREALETIMRERGGVRLDALRTAMGKSFFGEGGLWVKKDTLPEVTSDTLTGGQPPPVEESRLRRMMRAKYEEMLKGSSRATVSKQIANG